MTLEQKLKNLDRAKEKLQLSINMLMDAGELFDEVVEIKTNRFYKERWQINQLEQEVKLKARELRLQAEMEDKEK